jgi:pseudouridine-5'-phosphate glycosidase/pseudouridine kinase
MRVVGEAALSGSWALERTRPDQHQVVAKGKNSLLVLKHYPAFPIKPTEVVNVTGAGDSFVGALLADISQGAVLDTPHAMDKLVGRAQRASVLSLYSADAISPSLSDSTIGNPM